ncbi:MULTISPECIES: ATP-binding protein [unclassified Carboxylicivirga]|uniref:ATP-binding protein n=1 Tax=Carboxylicivirga TaxID=1628153 RepID=UPI003D347D90
MNEFNRLFESEAKWGEKKAMQFRWVLLTVIIVLISYIYSRGHRYEALVSAFPIALYGGYNFSLYWILKKHTLHTWVPYLSVTIDIVVLSLHIYNYSILFSPIGVATAASAFIYPILILMAVLRYDRRLVIYATLLTLFCYNLIYYLRLSAIDSQLIGSVVSADPAGHFYRSIYMGLLGYFTLNIPAMIDRLVAKQAKILSEKNKADLDLALEKQKKKMALQRLDAEKEVTKKLADQKEKISQQNEELQQLNQTKDRLFSIIGHDLRNPFTVQKSIAQLLLTDIDNYSKEDLSDGLKVILRSADTGNDLLNNLLQWARSQSARLSYQPQPLNLTPVIRKITGAYQDMAAQKSITVTIQDNSKNQGCVKADINMVQTILRNLIVNAIKFSYEQGEITIQLWQQDGYIKVAIKDQGVGIDSERLPLLFEYSKAISTPGTGNEKGTGLGLILCKEFVMRNGGQIHVYSKKGEGSTFIFTLPAN